MPQSHNSFRSDRTLKKFLLPTIFFAGLLISCVPSSIKAAQPTDAWTARQKTLGAATTVLILSWMRLYWKTPTPVFEPRHTKMKKPKTLREYRDYIIALLDDYWIGQRFTKNEVKLDLENRYLRVEDKTTPASGVIGWTDALALFLNKCMKTIGGALLIPLAFRELLRTEGNFKTDILNILTAEGPARVLK